MIATELRCSEPGSISKNAAPTTTAGKTNGTLTSEINARRPINLKLDVTAAIGNATRSTKIVLSIACQVVNHTTSLVVCVVRIFSELNRNDIPNIFSAGATTNSIIPTTGTTANHGVARR